ncbi:TniQ family protein [Endozoicomonas numazuensis]|uniref:TniQ domain-containing protein n=1 Tax=Endozoicomonas numazuensis TaxID=1137799 RepID=A0A081NLT2_9GAMM|nr:TniQ family protein [Endozoicomonas numazuensis]KEQ19405.1 hypothetical protein GZ78_05480 [Endozoicomonas numazuensis]
MSDFHIYSDETLESAIIRILKDLKLSYNVAKKLYEIPFPLHQLNTKYNKRTEIEKSISNFEKRLNLPCSSLSSLLLKRIDNPTPSYIENRFSYTYKNNSFPIFMYRTECIPICPLCLKENNYIPYFHHLCSVIICLKHKVYLVEHCPICKNKISYIRNESISKCTCGAQLQNIKAEDASSFYEKNLFIIRINLKNHDPYELIMYFCMLHSIPINNQDGLSIKTIKNAYHFLSDIKNNIPKKITSDTLKALDKNNKINTIQLSEINDRILFILEQTNINLEAKFIQNMKQCIIEGLKKAVDIAMKRNTVILINENELSVLFDIRKEKIFWFHLQGFITSFFEVDKKSCRFRCDHVFFLHELIYLHNNIIRG